MNFPTPEGMCREMAIDVPEPAVFTVEAAMATPRSVRPSKSSVDVPEEELDDRCCLGLINLQTALQLLALLNFILDAMCTFLALQTPIAYFFALSATGSLLCLCAIISSVQEEKHKALAATSLWPSLKLLVEALLYVTATAALLEFYLSDDSFVLTVEMVSLFALTPFCLLAVAGQWRLTRRVAQLFRARDEFYVIPSAHGSVHMRPSLRLHFAAQKLRDMQQFERF